MIYLEDNFLKDDKVICYNILRGFWRMIMCYGFRRVMNLIVYDKVLKIIKVKYV